MNKITPHQRLKRKNTHFNRTTPHISTFSFPQLKSAFSSTFLCFMILFKMLAVNLVSDFFFSFLLFYTYKQLKYMYIAVQLTFDSYKVRMMVCTIVMKMPPRVHTHLKGQFFENVEERDKAQTQCVMTTWTKASHQN